MQLTFTTILRVLLFATAISLSLLLYDNTLFAWHPVCMSLGYILFMAEGVLSALSFRTTLGLDRVTAIQSHGLMQLRAVICALIGFGVIYRNKVLHEKPHFVSLHAKFGLATFILSMLAPLGGVLSFRKLGFIQKFPEAWQPWIKALHRQVGVITWLSAMVTVQLALQHHSVNKGLLTVVWQASCAAVTAMILLLVFQRQAGKTGGGTPQVKAV